MVARRFFAISILLSVVTGAFGFDTGTHSDMTSAAMIDAGFSSYAIKTARLENWLVDYYSNTGDYQLELEAMHFDNLTTTLKCRIYWGYLTNNVRAALQKAAMANDPFTALCLMGMSFHAVQDFYAHSTWANTHNGGFAGFRTDTWFSNTPGPGDTSIYTGKYPNTGADSNNKVDQATFHGLYTWGVNKDNFNRPFWVTAEVFSYAATYQWILGVRQWVEEVSPGFFNKMLTYNDNASVNDLNRDLVYLYYISLWVYDPSNLGWIAGSDGRWKAFGSGSLPDFLAVAALFKATPDDIFTNQFKLPLVTFRQLLTNLYNFGGYVPGAEPIPVPKLNKVAVVVRTLSAADNTFLGINGLLGANFYALVSVGNQRFIETERPHQSSGATAWLTVKLVSNASRAVKINYQLWHQATTPATIFVNGVDEVCDINPKLNVNDLTFTFDSVTHICTGDVNGVFDTPGKAFTASGTENNKSTVVFYVTSVAVQG